MAEQLIDSWGFDYENLSGYISTGHQHGIELTKGADGNPVTRQMCLNMEHYYAKARSGRFVPRNKADVSFERMRDDAICIVISPYGEWDLTSVITYRLLPERIIEATFEFSSEADFPAFEAFISNYFHEPTEPHIHIGGKWVQPSLGDREHRYWARDEQAVQDIRDSRLDDFLAEGKGKYEAPIDPLYYDYPVMVTPIGDSGWSVVHAIEREWCPSISANRIWRAHDFSLVGQDVSAGQVITCKAWMAYRELSSLDDALKLHESLT